MLRPIVCWLVLLVLIPPAPAQEDVAQEDAAKEPDKPATPMEQFQALVDEHRGAMQKFFEEYRKVEDNDARQKLFRELYPKPDEYGAKMLQLADDYADDLAAVKALVWVVSNDRSPNSAKALEKLTTDHIDKPDLKDVCRALMYNGSAPAQELLRAALDNSPHEDVQAWACYSLAKGMMRVQREPRKKGDPPSEAEKLLERVVNDFGEIEAYRGKTLSDVAGGDLFELRNLSIGCEAPDIEGEDIDGVKFKLTDYRGKVVVIDFWGHW